MLFDFLAGCLGGTAGLLVGYPLDTIKVNIQVKSTIDPNYQSILTTIYRFREKGLMYLYRGATSPLIGYSAVNAMLFGTYHSLETYMEGYNMYVIQLVSGGVAGLTSSFLVSPLELAKTRIQVGGPLAGSGPLDSFMKLYWKEGVKGISRGLFATMLRDTPANITYFAIFGALTKPPRDESAVILFIAGGLAGVASWVVPYPADVIKSKIQADGLDGKILYKNSYDCLIKTINGEGYVGLYKGLVPTILRAFPVNAFTFLVVGYSRKIFQKFYRPHEVSQISKDQDKNRSIFATKL